MSQIKLYEIADQIRAIGNSLVENGMEFELGDAFQVRPCYLPKPLPKKRGEEVKEYLYIAPHIVGNLENWGYCYDSNGWRFDTKEKCQRFAVEELGHDDFWIGETTGGKLIALYNSNLERRDTESEKIEIVDIMKEWSNLLPDNPNKCG